MKNFIFKSSDFGLIKNVSNQLTIVLSEQRAQRADLADILRQLNKVLNQSNLQKQVDEFYEEQPEPPETGDLD